MQIEIQNANFVDTYHASNIVKKLGIKRDPSLFSSIQDLWTLINPMATNKLSKDIYLKLNSFIYSDVIPNLPSLDLAHKFALQDADVDFGKKKDTIVFKQFYDSMFEILDNNVKTHIVSDYINLIKKLYSMVQRSLWYNQKDLFLTSEPSRATSKSFHKWMIKHIREDFTASRPSHNIQRIVNSRGHSTHPAINFNHLPPEGRRRNVGTASRPRRRCRTRNRN